MDVLSFFGNHFLSSSKSKKKFGFSPTKNRTTKPSLELLENRLLPSCNTICGYVFRDANANGLFDAGESPIANSSLELRNADGQVVGTTVTNSNGYYEFTHNNTVDTTPITTEQTVTIPTTVAGFDITKQINQFDPALGELLEVEIIHAGSITSDIRAENSSTLVGSNITAVVSGKMTLSGPGFTLESTVSENAGSFVATKFDNLVDFGGTSGKTFDPVTAEAQTKSIKLTGSQLAAFIGTGQLDLTENVEVNSTATGGGNVLVGINSSATAEFTVRYKYRPGNCLVAGDYTIVQTQQPNLPNSTDPYLDGKESKNGVIVPDSIGTDEIHVTLANSDSTKNNFAEIAPNCLSGFVYSDRNDNGIKENGETGIAGVTVNLTGVDDQGPVSLSTLTGSDGSYSFENLRPGTYSIIEVQPAGFTDGKDTLGTAGGTVGNDQFTGIALSNGKKGENYNFGEFNRTGLSGFVYHDQDNDGVKDATERGISGVRIRLTGTTSEGPVIEETTTGTNGSYQFTNLLAGNYTIEEVQPENYIDGKDTIGTQDGDTSNDRFSNIELTEGTVGTDNNFGELCPASLSGFVYVDNNDNGIMDIGEDPIPGVTIRLNGRNDTGAFTQETTTGADGSYEFEDLAPGTYELSEVQPPGFGDGQDTPGSNGGDVANDRFTGIILASADDATDYNFGERRVTDLRLDKDVSATTIPAGGTFTYTITVRNLGLSEAEDLEVLDTLPEGVSFVSASAVGWNVDAEGNSLRFTRSNLDVGDFSTITITAIAPPREGTYLNRAVVSTSTLDVNPNNNMGTATFNVPAPPTQGVEPPPAEKTCLVILFSYDQWWLA